MHESGFSKVFFLNLIFSDLLRIHEVSFVFFVQRGFSKKLR